MRKRILASIVAITTVALLLTYIAVIGVYYHQSKESAQSMVRDEATMLAVTLDHHSRDEQMQTLQAYKTSTNVPRITFVNKRGYVLYDSAYVADEMGNHSTRPEIADAMSTGDGVAIRKSTTARSDLMYYAVRLHNGDVVRVSRPVQTMYEGVVRGAPVLAAVALVMFVLAYVVARHQAKHIVEPLKHVDLEHPLEGDVYPEFRPLLERIESQNKNKEYADQSRREFTANVSHELKTPLTSISGYAELIRNGLAKPADVPNFADRIYQEAQRLLTLIRDIIALSRLDEQQGSDHAHGENEQAAAQIPSSSAGDEQREIDLTELAGTITTRLIPMAEKQDVRLDYSGADAHVYGSEHLLDELISNLVDNAIKYNKPGGWVRVWVGMMQEHPTIVVADNGIGIDRSNQERVFERFYRVDKSRSQEIGGTGLGLSIVKHVAAIHHADIQMESARGVGTKITVRFPSECAIPE